MSFLAALGAAVPDLLGSAFSLFGANKARQQAKGDAFNKFADLRDAAINGGFNPLTALQATGGAGFGAYPSSAPPLASVELLTGGLQKASDEVTGVAAQRRAADRLNLDMAQLRLDQARSGVVAYAPRSSAGGVGSGPPVLGRSAKTVATTAGPSFNLGSIQDWVQSALTGGREEKKEPVSNSPGVSVFESPAMGGRVVVPGSGGEPWGIDELITFGLVGAPQVLNNHYQSWVGKPLGAYLDNKIASVASSVSSAAKPENAPRDYSKDRAKASDWWKHQFPSN